MSLIYKPSFSEREFLKEGENILSPLDSRYKGKVEEIRSEKYRLYVQCKTEYLWAQYVISKLCVNQNYTIKKFEFNQGLIDLIKEKEEVTKHDVKAIELSVAETFFPPELHNYVHIGLTSEDINSVSIVMLMRENANIICGQIYDLLHVIENNLIPTFKDYMICARTHGQKAVTTTWSKRFDTMYTAINTNLLKLKYGDFNVVKFGGAINQCHCMKALLRTINNDQCSDSDISEFINESPLFKSGSLKRDIAAFQTPLYDTHAEHFQTISRIAHLISKLAMDVWQGCKDDHFDLDLPTSQVGSSVMCQKKNPIGFENGAGNMNLVVTLCNHMANNIQEYILERDIRDSTQLRNIPLIYGHFMVGIKSIINDLESIKPSSLLMSQKEVIENGQIFSAEIMTALRILYPDMDVYDHIRKITQGKQMTMHEMYITVAPMFSQKNRIELLRTIMMMQPGGHFGKELPFIRINTSNPDKQKEFERYFAHYGYYVAFKHENVKEPRADHSIVANYKACRCASTHIYDKRIVLAEDTALHVEGEDVGSNVKHLLHRLRDYVGSKACFSVIISYYDHESNRVYFHRGQTSGIIVEPRGNGFGFDNVFQPINSDKTYGEMTPEEKEINNARKKAVESFVKKIKSSSSVSTECIFKWSGGFQG